MGMKRSPAPTGFGNRIRIMSKPRKAKRHGGSKLAKRSVSKAVRGNKTNVQSEDTFANHELVVLAAYLAGGSDSYADTEDVAIKANEIAPGRFTWRKYKGQINIETVRKRLWDAAKAEKGGYLVGSERDGWLLTETGLRFCKKHLRKLKVSHSPATRYSQREQTWITRERVRMLAEPAYQKFAAGQITTITPIEAERFFRVDDYVIGTARKTKIERSIAAFAGDTLLGKATRRIAELVRSR